jgi:methylated-DNA-[protein]-cysteine S-methyltransferase
MEDETVKYRYIDSPIGEILIAGDDDGLHYIGFPEGKGRIEPGAGWTRNDAAFADAARQLAEYFAGERRSFDLKLSPHGTRFQLAVLQALQRIPYGETRSYADIARAVATPRRFAPWARPMGAIRCRSSFPATA